MRNNTITKEKIVEMLKAKFGLSGSICEEIVKQIFNEICELTILNQKLTLKNFGSFSIRNKHARSGINFQTKEKITIISRKIMRFLPAKALKTIVNSR